MSEWCEAWECVCVCVCVAQSCVPVHYMYMCVWIATEGKKKAFIKGVESTLDVAENPHTPQTPPPPPLFSFPYPCVDMALPSC